MNRIDTINFESSPVNCLHPSFILNSDWLALWRKYKEICYIDDNGVFHTAKYSTYSNLSEDCIRKIIYSDIYKYVNINNYQYFYFKSDALKVPIPLFYLFKCGTCPLCRSQKASEYAFRSICESVKYPQDILFVTLTYKSEFLPKNGVEVSACQKYFKRLRAWLSERRMPTDFRYFLVSEYGAKYGRPHYHFILWNFPVKCFKTLFQMEGSLRFAWMTYKFDNDGKRQYVYSKRKRRYYPIRTTLGLIDIKYVTPENGCTAYITKYFRKDSGNKLNYPNKTFILSSRKNGSIGASVIDDMRDECLRRRLRQVSVLEPISGRVFSHPVSGYIKYRIFPCRSTYLARKKVYKDISDFSYKYTELSAIAAWLRNKGVYFKLKPLSWTPVKRCLSMFGRWVNHFDSSRLLLDYSFYQCCSVNTLNALACSLFNDIKIILNKLKLFAFKDFNFEYLQNQKYRMFLNQTLNVKRYNISASLYYNELSHSRYLQTCTF